MNSDAVAKILSEIPKSVTTVAVSKLQSADQVRSMCASHGVRDFGENYVQEAALKIQELKELKIHWHFIGHLQKNKAKSVVGSFDLIHSVDSLSLAQAIHRQADEKKIIQKILLQVNIAEEQSKGGLRPSEVERVFLELQSLTSLAVLGLMTMPPLDTDNRIYFKALRKLKESLQSGSPDCRFLSMGTSSDYKVAIEEGATHVRLGTILFGARPPR